MKADLAYAEKGKGENIVLLHGFCESKAIWQKLIEELSAHARLLAPDLPGFGENNALDADISIEEMAEQIAYWMDKKNVESAVIIGHSLGGYVALALADIYPQKVSGLCLFHSTAKADSVDKKEKRNKTVQFLEANGVSTFVKNFIPSLFAPSNRESMEPIIQEVIGLAAQTPDASAIAVTKAMRDRPERFAVLESADFPCLFIAGKDDSAVPYQDLVEQSKLPANAQLVTLEKCGHMGMYEKPEACRLALMELIQR